MATRINREISPPCPSTNPSEKSVKLPPPTETKTTLLGTRENNSLNYYDHSEQQLKVIYFLRPLCLRKCRTLNSSLRSVGAKMQNVWRLPRFLISFLSPILHPSYTRPPFPLITQRDKRRKIIFQPNHHTSSPSPSLQIPLPHQSPSIPHLTNPKTTTTAARIKRNRKSQQIKFKVRCHRFLYTLVLKDSNKADKLKQSLPPST